MAQKNVQITIEAKDNTKIGVDSATSALERFAAAQQKTAAYKQLQISTKEIQDQLASATTEVTRFAVAIRAAGGDPSQSKFFGQMVTGAQNLRTQLDLVQGRVTSVGQSAPGSFAKFEQAVEKVGRATDQAALKTQILSRLNTEVASTARGSFAAFEQVVKALDDVKIAGLGAETRFATLGTHIEFDEKAFRKLADAADKANVAVNKASVKKGGLVDNIVDTAATAKGKNFLGLRPYEVQNLGYQINDVVSGVLSKQPLTQIAAQQGGQIAQLFPELIKGALRAAPAIAAVAAVVVTLYQAVKRITDLSDSEKQFSTELLASADGAQYSASALAKTAQQLDTYGGSLEDARATLSEFIKDHVNTDYLFKFGKTAKDLSDVMSIDLKQAAGEVGKAFTGNYDAIKKLDDQYNFLTVAQRDHIRSLYEEGDAQGARTEALKIFSSKMGEASANMKGPWKTAMSDLGSAWNSFLDFLGNLTPIQNIISNLEGLAKTARDVAAVLDQLGHVDSKAADPNARVGANLDTLNNLQIMTTKLTQANKDLEKQYGFTYDSAKQTQFFNAYARAYVRNTDQIKKNAVDAEKVAQAIKTDYKLANPTGDTTTSNDQSKLKAQDDLNQSIAEGNKKRVEETAALGKSKRELSIIQAIQAEDAKAKAAGLPIQEKGLYLTKAQQDSIRASAGALYDANKAQQDGASAANKAATAAKEKAKREAEFLQSLKESNAERAVEVGLVGTTGRELAIQTELHKEDVAARKAGFDLQANGTYLSDEQTKSIRDSVGGLYDANKAEQDRLEIIKAQLAVVQLRGGFEEKNAYIIRQLGVTDLKNLTDKEKILAEIYGREYDIEKSKFDQSKLDTNVSGLQGQQSALQQQIEFLKQQGKDGAASVVQKQLDAVNQELIKAVEKSLEFYKALDPATNPNAAGTILGLQNLLDSTKALGKDLVITKQQFDETFASNATDALTTFIQKVVSGRAVIKSLGEAIIQTASDTALWVAKLIEQNAILTLIRKTPIGKYLQDSTSGEGLKQAAAQLKEAGILWAGVSAAIAGAAAALKASASTGSPVSGKSGGGILGTLLNSAIGFLVPGVGKSTDAFSKVKTTVLHSGGIVGAVPTSRSIASAYFANAQRYHTGGMIGLKPDERAIIGRVGEEMITADDPRHRNNGGAATSPNIKIVNAFSEGEFLSSALNSAVGERAIFNHFTSNKQKYKSILGK